MILKMWERGVHDQHSLTQLDQKGYWVLLSCRLVLLLTWVWVIVGHSHELAWVSFFWSSWVNEWDCRIAKQLSQACTIPEHMCMSAGLFILMGGSPSLGIYAAQAVYTACPHSFVLSYECWPCAPSNTLVCLFLSFSSFFCHRILSNNALAGPIPSEISRLTKLGYMYAAKLIQVIECWSCFYWVLVMRAFSQLFKRPVILFTGISMWTDWLARCLLKYQHWCSWDTCESSLLFNWVLAESFQHFSS